MFLQRTFSSFPSGAAGIALLVLRLVVGGLSSLQAGLLISGSHAIGILATLAAISIAAISIAIAGSALMIGFLTPIMSVLVCMAETGILLTCPHMPLLLFDSRIAAFEFVVMSAVLVVLGPGAISLDARLFGRREVVIREPPRRSRG